MEVSEAENVVRAMLATAGLSPSPEEIAQLVAGYPALRASVDALHRVREARYADPALRFRAADNARIGWAAPD